MEGFRTRCPNVSLSISQAEVELTQAGGNGGEPVDWFGYLCEPGAKRQSIWGMEVSARKLEQLRSGLTGNAAVAHRSCGGIGAGSWLLATTEDIRAMPDPHFLVVLRRRLLMPICPPGATCHHRRPNGVLCGKPLDPWGEHALLCAIGGARDKLHNDLRDWAARTHADCTGIVANTEQHVPQWDIVDQVSGEVEEAILDVATFNPHTGGLLYIDTTVTCELSTNDDTRRARAARDGVAVASATAEKHRRYPPTAGLTLVAAAFEAGGRPGEETVAFVRQCGTAWGEARAPDPDDPIVPATSRLWQECATVLQLGNAERLLSAVGR